MIEILYPVLLGLLFAIGTIVVVSILPYILYRWNPLDIESEWNFGSAFLLLYLSIGLVFIIGLLCYQIGDSMITEIGQ